MAGTLSGIPSTVHAVATGRPVLQAARAAGTLLPGGKATLPRGLLAHAGVTAFWSAVLAAALPRNMTAGAAAGLAIAALDLGVIARRYPAIRALPPGPQIADHLAFGISAAATLKAISQLRSVP